MNKGSISKRITFSIISVVLILIVLFTIMNQFYINYIWFDELGFTQVFMRELITKLQIGIPSFLVFFIILYLYFNQLTKVIRKKSVVTTIKKTSNKIVLMISLILSIFITVISTNSLWYRALEFLNSSSFNQTDPLFNKDISFYIFKLPLLEQVYSTLISVLFILVISTIIYTSYLYLSNTSRADFIQDGKLNINELIKNFGALEGKLIGVFIGIFFILMSFSYYIRTFSLLYSNAGISFGASYTDVNVTLPLYRILMVVSIILGVYAIICGLTQKIKRIIIAPIVLVVFSLVGGLVTIGVDNLIVTPNQFLKEEQYLVRNIEHTQLAYGIDSVVEEEFNFNQNITIEDIEENELTIKNIPINDYRPTLDMYNSIQGFRIYYEFNDVDIDRYYIDGEYTQVFISAREMNNTKLEENARTWINTHLKYTHGFGVAVSPINTVNESGQPALVVKDIPPKTDVEELQVTQPRIYYGESTDTYAITNGMTMEFDYPEGSDNAENYYDGTGGIQMNMLNRLAFALYHAEPKIMLSSDLTSDSKMHIKRNIIERVNTIAPFLAYDDDPYITIADGKLYWIMDAFTISERYPYSQPYSRDESFNYIRNSVKVVIDAFNGDVTFYQVDENEPITNVYNKIYPDMFTPIDEMPESIRSHIRYSQKMFDIQSNIYRTYHMTNPRVFYNKEDQWEVATQIYGQNKEVENVESAYLIMKQPDSDEEQFVLMVPYTPRQKDNMVGWMAAMNDGEDYGKIVVYKFPKQTLAYGPMQIEQRIDQDTLISPQLTLLGQQGSEVSRGNMLTIPINNSILYVEPVYIGASGTERSIPEVKKVIVSHNNRIVMEDDLSTALEKIFGTSEKEEPDQSETDDQIDPNNPPINVEDSNSLIIKANELFKQAQQAQQSGDWAEYGRYIKELEETLNKLDVNQ
ncbi:UPF0182 family protein [Alkalibaculum sp. M08DMB]|uniref:UPF0182 protein GC105_16365 n=1 Tax=Alkalibaculum sporogenes TaxID=2655001 RepID=A0A6A7KDC5_9FIRM|nr:UPF0182 family protein [Alkalibaculum sporogenes]MPW27341.1 UPF0182 family protein [Alkalibaculum sporogenes]